MAKAPAALPGLGTPRSCWGGRYSHTVPALWCDSNISTDASSRFTCGKRHLPSGSPQPGHGGGHLWAWGCSERARRGCSDGKRWDAGGFRDQKQTGWAGKHTEGGAGSSRTHRVGDMSHGFDVEELLEYELQLIVRALGRPGRGAGGEQPSVPPLPTRSRGIDNQRQPPGQATSFSPRERRRGRPIHCSRFGTSAPPAWGRDEPSVPIPGPWGAPATHGLRRAMVSSASGPSWARKASASSSSSASRSPAPGSGLSSSSAKR